MGKDADACCEACRLFGDQTQLPPVIETPVLAAPHDRVKIEVYKGSTLVAEVLPTSAKVMIGRGSANDVVLADGAVSRRQCMLSFDERGVVLADTGSTCGTYLNGHRIAQAQVPEDAKIHIANFMLRVVPR